MQIVGVRVKAGIQLSWLHSYVIFLFVYILEQVNHFLGRQW